jgi:diaminopimelate decarboxylase
MFSSTDSPPNLQTDIAGHRVADLIQRFGAPLYVFDAATIAQRVAEWQRFDVVRYAVDASSSLAVLDRIRCAGAAVSVANAMEIRRALAAGFEPYRVIPNGRIPGISYSADICDRESLDLIAQKGLHVVCGSADMIDQLGQRRPGAEITLCIDPGTSIGKDRERDLAGVMLNPGIWHEQVDDCLLRADQYGIAITGLQMQVDAGGEREHVEQACERMKQTVSVVGRTVTTIGISGSVPSPAGAVGSCGSVARDYECWHSARQSIVQSLGHAVRLEINLSNRLVADAGRLIAEVRAVKKRGEIRTFVIDGGAGDFIFDSTITRDYRISISPRDGSNHDRPEVDAIIAFPPRHAGHVVRRSEGESSRRLPIALVGDYVILSAASAFGQPISDKFSGTRPAEIMIENGQAKVIRARQTYDDVVHGEVIPD